VRHIPTIATVLTVLLCMLAAPVTASASKTYECQKPVMTGVEVSALHDISQSSACPPALALYAWENAKPAHATELYGCHRKAPDQAGYPYLKLHSFRGFKLSLVGKPYGTFTMSRGASSFHVGGTDFPLNCS
jgi:hypothetical protein